MNEKVKETLEKQMQLLSERSQIEELTVEELSYLTRSMTDVARELKTGVEIFE